LIGGGIGSLAAAFLVRDGGFAGDRVTVFESAQVMGGSLDANGTAENGYVMRGGRMFTADNYECTWDLFKSIPSLFSPGESVYTETMHFNDLNKSHSMTRLVDSQRARVPVTSMGFGTQDRIQLLRLSRANQRGRWFLNAARRAFLATRPLLLIASVLPVLVGPACAARTQLKQGIELTLAIQAAGCMLICMALLLGRFF
jgi:uncharacterized protein with NAD-binding domain and iron-sulfur cluster